MLLLRGQSSHRGEAGQDQRVDAGLGPAGEDRVGVAATDDLGPLPHRVRARGAGRDRRVVRPLDPERDRELPARRVDEHVRDEVRRDPVRPALSHHFALLHDPNEAADRRAEEDPDPHRVVAVQARVGDRLFGGGEREKDVPVESPQLLRGGEAVGLEVLDLGGNSHRQPVGVKSANEVDPASAFDSGAPGLGRGAPDRSDGPQARDDDATHRWSLGDAHEYKPAEFAAAKRRPAKVVVAGRLELVDEALKRRPVVQVAADDVERNAEEGTDPRLAARARDALLDADHRREDAADALHVPDAVELAHG